MNDEMLVSINGLCILTSSMGYCYEYLGGKGNAEIFNLQVVQC